MTDFVQLELTREQAERLLALVTVGDMAVNWNLQPALPEDQRLLAAYIERARANVSLERPLARLREWIGKQERSAPK